MDFSGKRALRKPAPLLSLQLRFCGRCANGEHTAINIVLLAVGVFESQFRPPRHPFVTDRLGVEDRVCSFAFRQ